ncbi:MAG: hypothetical protein ACRC33_08385, partial [Gemmataceae bacterium]
ARDATNEAARQQGAQMETARRLRRQRDRARRHAAGLLDLLAAAPLTARPGGPSAEDMLGPFRALRNDLYPAAARRLHELAGKGESRDFQLILAERVMRKGQRTLTEASLRRPDADRAELHARLREHLGTKLVKHLTKRAACRVNPEGAAALEDLMTRSLRLIDDLLTTDPPARLFWPEPGQHYDPAAHERGGGKAGGEHRVIRAVLFPGLRAFGPVPTVLERASVATMHAEE